ALSFPGGHLIGCAAGFLNVSKIKGSHTAMKSGMVAAEIVARQLAGEPADFRDALAASWVWPELRVARNIRPGFRWGLWAGLAHAAFDTYILRGKAPWTLRQKADHLGLQRANAAPPIVYPKPDGAVSFDRSSSIYLSNVNHEENQPPHLRLRRPDDAIAVNYALFDSPETRYCPAGVYEIVESRAGAPRLQINAANCVHCKTCDIKDPTQNIDWVVPEGGGGPNYPNM
ncbi:MAG: electron transfer flavoprotein-ubiquinone oxidoreductase, partial [Stellaceae bacterium]